MRARSRLIGVRRAGFDPWFELTAVATILRPLTLATTGMVTTVGFALGARNDVHAWWLASLVTSCAVGASMVYNDIVDIDADLLNRPNRPLPARRLSMRSARALLGVLAAVTLVAASRLGLPMLVWAAASLGLGLAYSRWLQRVALLGNLLVAGLFANAVVYGAAAGGEVVAVQWLAAIEVLWFIAGRELLKGIPDVQGDRATGTRTVASTFGPKVAVDAYIACLSLGLATSVIGIVMGQVCVWHAVAIIGLVVVPGVFVGTAMRSVSSQQQAISLLDKTAFIWLSGVASLLTLRPC